MQTLPLSPNNQKIERGYQFHYLGSIISYDFYPEMDVKYRTENVKTFYRKMFLFFL